jgi:hypothetical protein
MERPDEQFMDTIEWGRVLQRESSGQNQWWMDTVSKVDSKWLVNQLSAANDSTLFFWKSCVYTRWGRFLRPMVSSDWRQLYIYDSYLPWSLCKKRKHLRKNDCQACLTKARLKKKSQGSTHEREASQLIRPSGGQQRSTLSCLGCILQCNTWSFTMTHMQPAPPKNCRCRCDFWGLGARRPDVRCLRSLGASIGNISTATYKYRAIPAWIIKPSGSRDSSYIQNMTVGLWSNLS